MSFIGAAGPVHFLALTPPGNETSITTMPESGLIVLAIGAMILLGVLLLAPVLAVRTPRRKGPASTPPWTGPVQGGVHLGDGRSVAPHRDAPAEAFDEETIRRGQAAQATVIRDEEEDGGAPGDSPGTE